MSVPATIASGLAALALAACASSSGGEVDATIADAPPVADASPADAAPGAPTVVTPNGGETWRPGTGNLIEWTSSGALDTVDIQLWKAGALSLTIATGVVASGASYNWSIPSTIARAADYRIRILAGDDPARYDESDADFAIDDRELTVTAPSGGAEITAGDATLIAWTSTGDIGLVDLELYQGTTKVVDIATNVADGGSYNWTVPTNLATSGNYTVVVSDADQPTPTAASGLFTIHNWHYRVPITVTSAVARTDFPVLIELTASNFSYFEANPNGNDLRFATSPNRANGFDLPYYIESWVLGGTSRIWVLVPSLSAGGGNAIYLFYGHSAATTTSDDAAALPVRYVATDGEVLSGDITVHLFTVASGQTVNLTSTPVTVTARIIDIAGTIDGVGHGDAGGGTVGGSGAGGGGGSTNSGGGGGGYGGLGGLGGYDTGDTPGSRGAIHGDVVNPSIALGSGGGGPSDVVGGNGGGALTLRGRDIRISGSLAVDGADGVMGSLTGRGSGGGSGGGLLLYGHDLTVTGSLSATGGDGGTSTSTSNDGGGGGGGGRIKLLYAGHLTNTASLAVSGGAGGSFGDAASGEDGGTGTTHVATTTSDEPTIGFSTVETVF